jgi:hypothetical protein
MADPNVVQAEPDASVSAPAPADPFSVDESKLVTLAPEQRAALDPIFNEWKTKAKGEIEKSQKSWQEKLAPIEKESQALRELVKDQRFQQWWQNITGVATQQNPQAGGAIQQSKPQDFASPQEWQEAILDASNGDSTKLQSIQQRMYQVMATPVIQRIEQGQQELKTTFELKDLWERHPDAKDLDAIGRSNDPNDQTESLLESCLNWAADNGKSLEEGYMRARKWADALKVGAQQQAMGLVQGKKESVTSGPSTAKGGQAVVEVSGPDELMQKNMEYLAAGQTPPRFVIRNQEAPKGQRWENKG